MSKPLVVVIPHRLGRIEAARRLRAGIAQMRTHGSFGFAVQEEAWTDDSLAFRIGVLGQSFSGTIDVGDSDVRLEVMLPWLLRMLAEKIKPAVESQGHRMLEKP